tara:strand:- start:1189 stop:1344 length:156 start_codon:yes stop_codon:yes gene_type:complete
MSEEKSMFMLTYIFNIDSSKKGADLVTEAHEAWERFRFFCDERKDEVYKIH